MRGLRIAFGVAAACAAGCLFPSLSGLSGDDPGGTDAGDSGGTDVTQADVIATDGGASNFCATVDATFCEDFDEPDGDFLSRWTTAYVDPGNSLGPGPDNTSPPNGLVASVPAQTGSAAIWKDLPANATSIAYSFDVRFEPYDAGSGSMLFNEVEVDSTDASTVFTEYRFVTFASTTEFQAHVYFPDGGNTIDHLPLASTFAPSRWYHIDETLVLVPPPTHVTVLVDGAVALSTTLNDATNGTGWAEFLAGIYHTNPTTGAWTIHVDDVVLRAQ